MELFDPFLHDIECVAYMRLSTKKQKNFTWQQNVINDFCEQRNIVVKKWFKEHISGMTLADQRPIFMEACDFCEREGYTMIVASVDRLARNVAFPVHFGQCSFRGDFDLEIICHAVKYGHFSVEACALSMMQNLDMLEAGLEDTKEIKYLRKIEQSIQHYQ